MNPHSNGEIFSRSENDLVQINEFNKIKIRETKDDKIKIEKIIFFKRTLKLEALCTRYTKNIWSSSINRYIKE